MKKISLFGAIAVIFAMAFSFQANAENVVCPTLKSGDLFKVPNNKAVYYVDDNLNRLYFPNSEIFHSWFDDFSTVVEIPNICVDNYPSPLQPPYGVNYRSGAKLVKVQISPTVYAIEPGNKLAKIKSEEIAKELYGANWANLVRDVADAFWPNYNERGEEIIESKPHDGMFVQTPNNTNVYYVENGEMVKVDEKPTEDVRTIGNGVFAKLAVRSGTIETNTIYSNPVQKERNENAATPAVPTDTVSSTPAIPAVPSTNASSTSATPAVPATPANPTTIPTTPTVPATPAVPNNQADTTAPIISNIQATSITQTSATITWTTNEATASQLKYGLTSAYGNTTLLDSTLVLAHSIQITGLSASTTYHYNVKSTDAAGNISTSNDMIFITLTTQPQTGSCGGTISITDTRDINNPIYETVEIGTQCWSKRNLNVGTRIDGNADQTNNGILEKYCYSNSTETNCNTKGGLYQWDEMMNYTTAEGAQGICPTGWHVPTDVEYKTLEMYLGMSQIQVNTIGWRGNTEGDKLKNGGTSGYNAFLGGIRYSDGHWDNFGVMESIWASSVGSLPFFRYLQGDSSLIYRGEMRTVYGFSVRCIKGAGTPSTPSVPTQIPIVPSDPTPIQITSCGGITSVTDSRDTTNPVYDTIAIGNQCWMKRNLNIGIRIDGNANQTNNETTEKYCYENSESSCNTNGGLYQWNEAMNYSQTEKAQGICPSGWHIPTDAEWKTLEINQGMSQEQANLTGWRGTIEGDRLKNAGLCNTRIPCGTSGYSALLGGIRYNDGHWDNFGRMESIWTSSIGSLPFFRYLQGDSSLIYRGEMGTIYGFSVRCIKD